MDALLNVILAIPANEIPGVAAGGLWGFLGPLLLGMVQELVREFLRNRAMVNSGADQQRRMNAQAHERAGERAERVTRDVDEMSDAELVDALAQRLRH